ncbi:dynein light chain LC6, flagellar outer arm-like [Diaphorina citri]|uniref:Dynein light chain n=1 Tax=Diaphorina citri TaxID=121845 RepID=A0A1S3CVM3_DIACI|nr:dynein light chain LC6, flagellar outer arm-like [Diaphorina citri]KAI5735603.1 hypothetical protein M8J77_020503 [Diaphorina citri]
MGPKPKKGGAAPKDDKAPLIKSTDMPNDMQQEVITVAKAAYERCNNFADLAAYIKKEFENKYGPAWHCVVGQGFGSFVTHDRSSFIYLYIGMDGILLFRHS